MCVLQFSELFPLSKFHLNATGFGLVLGFEGFSTTVPFSLSSSHILSGKIMSELDGEILFGIQLYF